MQLFEQVLDGDFCPVSLEQGTWWLSETRVRVLALGCTSELMYVRCENNHRVRRQKLLPGSAANTFLYRHALGSPIWNELFIVCTTYASRITVHFSRGRLQSDSGQVFVSSASMFTNYGICVTSPRTQRSHLCILKRYNWGQRTESYYLSSGKSGLGLTGSAYSLATPIGFYLCT